MIHRYAFCFVRDLCADISAANPLTVGFLKAYPVRGSVQKQTILQCI